METQSKGNRIKPPTIPPTDKYNIYYGGQNEDDGSGGIHLKIFIISRVAKQIVNKNREMYEQMWKGIPKNLNRWFHNKFRFREKGTSPFWFMDIDEPLFKELIEKSRKFKADFKNQNKVVELLEVVDKLPSK